MIGLPAESLPELEGQLKNIGILKGEFGQQQPNLDESIRQGDEIVKICHPNAQQPMKHWMAVLSARWEEASQLCQQREDRIKTQIQALKDQDALLENLLKWLSDKEDHLNFVEEDPIPDDVGAVQRLLDEHQEFMGS